VALSGVPRVGETIEVTLRVSTSSGQVLREGHATAQFWAPGHVPGECDPEWNVTAVWDSGNRGFTAFVETHGWAPGTWTVRGKVSAGTPHGPATGISQDFPLLLRA
jgi:hypothetical protein